MYPLRFCRFDFVKSAGAAIVPIRLPGGLEVTGKVAKHVAGTGPVYTQAHESIIEREEVSPIQA